MHYYQCKRCNYISRQKIDMSRHLDKKKECKIIDEKNIKSDHELKKESLIKHNIDQELKEMYLNSEHSNDKLISIMDCHYNCTNCNKEFNNKSNLNKHIKRCNLKDVSTTVNQTKNIQINNNIQNIGVQNNIINININSLRGFDEDWNLSNITDEMREKLFLSDKKFTNTLENILQNKENLNVILKDKVTGLVYKMKNNEYEIMPVKNILEESMDKIYKHLKEFFTDIIENNKDDIREDILENELNEVDKKYQKYKDNLLVNDSVNSCLSNIFNSSKTDSIKTYIKMNNEIVEKNDALDLELLNSY